MEYYKHFRSKAVFYSSGMSTLKFECAKAKIEMFGTCWSGILAIICSVLNKWTTVGSKVQTQQSKGFPIIYALRDVLVGFGTFADKDPGLHPRALLPQ